ncbi:hypothetical protein P5V15_010025 [Pogonomyrmex californicus]
MNITELIKLLLYGSLLNYITALYHEEIIFDKISNEQINRPQTIRTKRSEIREITEEVTIATAYREYTPAINFRLPNLTIPKEYKIELTLATEEDVFYGECRIMFMILKATQNIRLHSANLEITQLILIGKTDKYIIARKARNISYIHELEIVVLDFSHVLHSGNYTLSITYKGVIANDVGGLVKVS